MDTFWNWWNSLTQTAREGIIVGLITTVAGGLAISLFTGFWKLVGKALVGVLKLTQKLLNRLWPPSSTEKPTLQTVSAEPGTLTLPAASVAADKSSEHEDTTPHEAASLIPRPPVVGFVVRRDEQGRDIVERLKEELAPGRNQLLTLSGAGGLGKTTLAAEAARGLQAVYEGRVTWSSADGRPDFSLLSLLDDIATQLGHAELRTLAPTEKEAQVCALVAGALAVLDNYETVAEAEQRRIETWLRQTQCSALFTSRPKVPGTIFVPVSAMSREEAAEFLEKLSAQTQDPQLFTEKVREQVYVTAEANPYLMQWVVAQIDDAKEPATVFEELSGGVGDAAGRVFARSFDLPRVGDDGRDVLLALSLFTPHASREALAEVAGLGADRKRLDEAARHLHALWLIKGIDGNRRLAVEGLTRTLAAARLSQDPRANEFRRRFVAYFLRYTKEREKPSPENYDALEAEKDNLLGASEVAFASGDWESVMLMAYALGMPGDGMLWVRGYWAETVKLGEQALDAAHSSKDEWDISALSHNIAVMYENRGEIIEARRLYEESLEIKKRLGDQSSLASTISQLGNVHYRLGDSEEAKTKHEESLAIRRKIGAHEGIAIDLHQLGMLAQDSGEIEEARRLYEESLGISKRLGNQGNVASTLNELGLLAQTQGETDEARRLYEESLGINKKLGNQSGIATSLHQLGRLAEDAGDKKEAARLFREALNILERLGSPTAEIARRSLARVEGEES